MRRRYVWVCAVAVAVACSSGGSGSGRSDASDGSSASDGTDGGDGAGEGADGGDGGDGTDGGDGAAPIEGSAGTAPADDVSFTGSLAGSGTGYREGSLSVAGASRTVGVYVPEGLPEHPALVLAFHGTGSNPADFLDEMGLRGFADQAKVLVLAAQALERNGGSGEEGDPDHYAGAEASWGTSWNLGDDDPNSNNDLLLTRAMIADARAAFGVDSDHVYAFGHSNGAFFSYHAAAVLSDRIAGFAENAGGAVRCANKGGDGEQFVGSGTSCDALKGEAGFPTCQGALQTVEPNVSGRIPFGYLAHHNDDDVVSVAWTCTLAAALPGRSQVFIKAPDDDSHGHSVVTDFPQRAWAYLSHHSRTE